MMQHNYYIGFQLPESLRQEISHVQRELFDARLMKTPLEPHITILPPPAVERVEPEELARQVKVTAAPFWPLRITLTGIETYKDYAIALSVECDQIFTLQQKLLALLPPEAEAIYFPSPTFSPHVTLAHALHGKKFTPETVRAFADKLTAALPVSYEIDHLTLFKWISPREYLAQPIQ